MRKLKTLKQNDIPVCGLACVAMLAGTTYKEG